MELPKRKPNRLPYFDYSTPGAYFITICTKDRKCIFWENVGASIARPHKPTLSRSGKIVETAIRDITGHYPSITVDHYVVMPNHIHLLLQINTDEDGRPMVAPTISTVVQQLKGVVTKQIGQSVWQKLFHDHVIRGEKDYLKIWEYIDTNPARWHEDCFFEEDLL
jgi:REP element-mobilizing transposase RayT